MRTAGKHRKLSSVLCDDPEGRDGVVGGREPQEVGGEIHVAVLLSFVQQKQTQHCKTIISTTTKNCLLLQTLDSYICGLPSIFFLIIRKYVTGLCLSFPEPFLPLVSTCVCVSLSPLAMIWPQKKATEIHTLTQKHNSSKVVVLIFSWEDGSRDRSHSTAS